MTDEQVAPGLYKALPPSHIRILHLDGFAPSPSLHGNVLVGRLETISLEDIKSNCEGYFALSYCWQKYGRTGMPIRELDPEDCYIWCNGCLIPLQPNLHSALWHLGKQKDGPKAIWVDALCINQSDVDEKTKQVSIMGDIYKSVGCVIAWLGSEGKLVEELFSALSFAAGQGPPTVHSESGINASSPGESPAKNAINFQRKELSRLRQKTSISIVKSCGKESFSYDIAAGFRARGLFKRFVWLDMRL